MSIKVYVPLGFSQVDNYVYRSSYPADKTYSFINTLNIKSFICLNPNDIRPELEEYCKLHSIQLFKFDLKHNQEPFLVMNDNCMKMILETIKHEQLQQHHVLIFCTTGKVRTGCVVACLRKKLGWSMSSIIEGTTK